jgi:translocation and assembly module TamB
LKNVITKSFLWGIVIIELIVLFVVFVLYVSSNPKTLEFIVDKVTKDKNITYENIRGSLLDSISLDNIKLNGETLVKKATISWNLKSIITSNIVINEIDIEDLNIYSIEKLLNKPHKKSSSKNRPLSLIDLEISKLSLNLLPYENSYIKIQTLDLNAKKIVTNLNKITIDSFDIDTVNNLTNIKTDGYLKDDTLHFNKLLVDEINVEKIKDLIEGLDLNDSGDKQTFEPFSNIEVTNLELSTLPFDIQKQPIWKLDLRAFNLKGDINSLLFDAKAISIDTKTDIASISTNGIVQANNLITDATINLDPAYFKEIATDIDFKNFNPIKVKLSANKEIVDANVTLKSKSVFKGRFKRINNKINSFKSQIHYDIKTKKVVADTDANVSVLYASSMILKDHLTYDGSLKYGGQIEISQLQHFPKYSLPLFKNALIKYSANEANLTANLNTDKLHLLYNMYEYKRADFFLDSKDLNISNYFDILPKQIDMLSARVDAKMSLDFKRAKDLTIDANISSNAINLTGKIDFKDGVNADAKATLVENSILKNFDKNIKLDKIFPSTAKLSYKKNRLHITNINDNLETLLDYDLNTTDLVVSTLLEGNKFEISGDKKELIFNTNIISLKDTQSKFSKIYNFNPIPLDGSIDLNTTISDMKNFKAKVTSKWLVYEYKPTKFAFAEKINLNLVGDSENITLTDYKLHAFILGEDRVLYANKPSTFINKNGNITLQELWVNDSLKTTGKFDLNSSTGVFHSTTENFTYKGKEGMARFRANIKTDLQSDKTTITGKATFLDALITYEHRNTHTIQDPDIIFVQEQEKLDRLKKEKSTPLIVDVSIDSVKDLIYKTSGIDLNFRPDLKFWKEQNRELELLGRVAIVKGKYFQDDKEFDILPGELLFGGDILNPYLNITAKHFSDPYDITIDISGKVDSPIINFSSNPYLSQSDILSILLFNTTTSSLFSGGGNTSNQAISFFGNTFAKEIVKKFGIKLDKLVILTNENGGFGIEVGKKISRKVTVIYINDIVQTIKVRYQHSDHFESDITISPESSGIDFIYKSEH